MRAAVAVVVLMLGCSAAAAGRAPASFSGPASCVVPVGGPRVSFGGVEYSAPPKLNASKLARGLRAGRALAGAVAVTESCVDVIVCSPSGECEPYPPSPRVETAVVARALRGIEPRRALAAYGVSSERRRRIYVAVDRCAGAGSVRSLLRCLRRPELHA